MRIYEAAHLLRTGRVMYILKENYSGYWMYDKVKDEYVQIWKNSGKEGDRVKNLRQTIGDYEDYEWQVYTSVNLPKKYVKPKKRTISVT